MTDLCRCRCCHAEGHFKNSGVSYTTNGIEEIFCEMLRETFGVNIIPLTQDTSQNTYSICSPCSSRLKDASDFKRQVVACEEKLLACVKGAELKKEVETETGDDFSNDVKEEYFYLEESEKERLSNKEEKESKYINNEPNQQNKPKKVKVKYSCDTCPKEFTYEGALQIHKKKHTGESHSCQLCDAKFIKITDLSKHIDESHQENGRYICTICNTHYKKVNIFKYHLKTHLGETYKCDHCNKEYTRKKGLVVHLKVHSGERNFVCEVCDKSFIHNQQLRYHMSVHSKEYKHTCKLRGKPFPQQSNLKRHYILVHSEGKLLYSCRICAKQFSSKQYMTEHEKEHSGERPYSCDYCEKGFKKMSTLKSHMTVHTGEKPYSCSYCDKRFAHVATVTSHERRHKGERPFACKVCAKAFVTSSSLRIHMRVHTGEKPYSCEICSRSFAEGGQLKRHMRGHTGEKFACNFCDKRYSNVYKHMRAKHPDEWLQQRVSIPEQSDA